MVRRLGVALMVLAGVIAVLMMGCGRQKAETPAVAEEPVPAEESAPVITKEEGESLVAYASLSEKKLYVIDQERLQSVLERGLWPALNWQSGEKTALLKQEEGEDVDLDIDLRYGFGGWFPLVSKMPEPGDQRYVEEFQKEEPWTQKIWKCRSWTGTHEGKRIVSAKYVRVEHTELIPEGQVMAAEVYTDVVRDYNYGVPGCKAEYLGHKPHVHQWIVKRGPWPNP